MPTNSPAEGNLEAPIRHPIEWRKPEFYDESALQNELARVFDHCHGCRRCVSLCNAFPTLFDLVDESETLEVDGVDKQDYWKVVEHCYLCDLCYQTKCPYTPPHPWNIDFPHLMLRAKAVRFKQGKVGAREKVLSATDAVGKLAATPIVVNAVNAANENKYARKLLKHTLGVHTDAKLPKYHRKTLRKQRGDLIAGAATATSPANENAKVAIFATCFGNYNEPQLGEDLIKVLQHNSIATALVPTEQCCGMPKMELGDLESVQRAKENNIPTLAKMVNAGWELLAPVPSCVLMFRQELPLLFPDDEAVQLVGRAMADPFEYLMRRHRDGLLNTEFKNSLGKVGYHAPCHQRVQKIGQKTRECLQLAPATEIITIERCSGHNGTYGVKAKFYEAARKIGKPVANKIRMSEVDHFGSDCPMAGRFIEHGIGDGRRAAHPISLLRLAYGI